MQDGKKSLVGVKGIFGRRAVYNYCMKSLQPVTARYSRLEMDITGV